MIMREMMLRSQIAAIRLVHHQSGIAFNFQFLFSCRNYTRRATNYVDVDERQLFLKSVRHECKLGFHKINHPLSLFDAMISLSPLPCIMNAN